MLTTTIYVRHWKYNLRVPAPIRAKCREPLKMTNERYKAAELAIVELMYARAEIVQSRGLADPIARAISHIARAISHLEAASRARCGKK